MKPAARMLQLLFVLIAVQFSSCDELTNDSPDNLRLLPGQVLSANIDASGNMYFMPQMIMAEGGQPVSYLQLVDRHGFKPSVGCEHWLHRRKLLCGRVLREQDSPQEPPASGSMFRMATRSGPSRWDYTLPTMASVRWPMFSSFR